MLGPGMPTTAPFCRALQLSGPSRFQHFAPRTGELDYMALCKAPVSMIATLKPSTAGRRSRRGRWPDDAAPQRRLRVNDAEPLSPVSVTL